MSSNIPEVPKPAQVPQPAQIPPVSSTDAIPNVPPAEDVPASIPPPTGAFPTQPSPTPQVGPQAPQNPPVAPQNPYPGKQYPQQYPQTQLGYGYPNQPPQAYYPPAGQSAGNLVGFWMRVAYSLIDGIILSIVMIPLYILWIASMASWADQQQQYVNAYGTTQTTMVGFPFGMFLVVMFLAFLIPLAYMTLCLNVWSATPGQMILKTTVVTTEGEPVKGNFGKALIRSIMIPVFNLVPFGSLVDDLWCLGDDRKQTLHDKIASTLVVYK